MPAAFGVEACGEVLALLVWRCFVRIECQMREGEKFAPGERERGGMSRILCDLSTRQNIWAS